MLPDYSAVIRTVRPSATLERLLDSLSMQTHPPAEVVISIPADVEPWPVDMKGARFVRSRRGMVSQRAGGILSALRDLLLLLDDDVVLARNAAEVVIEALERCQCVVPYAPSAWPQGASRWAHALAGIAIPRRTGGIEYTAGGGYYFPLEAPPPGGWPTAGGLGQVIGVDRAFLIESRALGDAELQAVSAFPAREDGAFVAMVRRAGGDCRMIPGVQFVHLGHPRGEVPEGTRARYQALVENHHAFWERHILPDHKSSSLREGWARLLVGVHAMGTVLIAAGAALRSERPDPLVGALRGVGAVLSSRRPRRATGARKRRGSARGSAA